jgi:hypothetical protein
LKGYFYGSIYDINPKFYEFFEIIFKEKNIEELELWTGTFNKTRGKTQLFCNKKKETSIIKESSKSNQDLLNYESYTYCDGNVNTIAKVAFASAAIPIIFPPIDINGESYTDGGNSFSSPLTPMKESLQTIYNNKPLHLFYITPYNYQAANTEFCYAMANVSVISNTSAATSDNFSNVTYTCKTDGSMYSQGKYAMSELLKSLTLQDRYVGLELVQNGLPSDSFQFEESILDYNDFNQLIEKTKNYYRMMMELYPVADNSIHIANFLPEDILNIIDKTEHIGVRYWYVDSST